MLLLLTACQTAPEREKQADAPPPADTIAYAQAPPDKLSPSPALPPVDYDTTAWAELIRLDPSLVLDLKYATNDNFVSEQMYDCGRCFLRPPAAAAVVRAHQQLQKEGLGIKLFDCYRPRPIQWKLWEKVPNPRYVADPRKGSMHNRGAAVDLTLVDAEGRELDMGTAFDFFGPEASPEYTALPDSVLQNRARLRAALMAEGFKPIRSEWWHFSYSGPNYELADMLWNCY